MQLTFAEIRFSSVMLLRVSKNSLLVTVPASAFPDKELVTLPAVIHAASALFTMQLKKNRYEITTILV